MFNKKEYFSVDSNFVDSNFVDSNFVGSNAARRLASTLVALSFCLIALLVPSTVLATDPMELDPDPDSNAPVVTIVVSHLDDANVESLPPGHYLIIVINEDGSRQTYEIWV